jgi:muramoyltetrapeptide carboxypeptidase
MDIIRDRVVPLNIPCVFGLQFGHVAKKLTVPMGAHAELDATKGSVVIEPSVQ